jgi:hypothetical protein
VLKKSLFVLSVLLWVSCSTEPWYIRKMHPSGHQDLRKLPLSERLAPAPEYLLEGMMELDQRDDYRSYSLSLEERAQLERIVNFLPQRLQNALTENLLCFYFVENFAGAGMADWVLAEDDKVAHYFLLNPELLQKTISEWLTLREGSMVQSGGLRLTITLEGDENSALLYALLHEGAHVLDYQEGITPFIEESFEELLRGRSISTFSQGVWDANLQPLAEWEIPQRENFSPYGLGAAVQTDPEGFFDILDAWKRSPFVSLYASLSVAEDWADWYTFTWLTQVKGYKNLWELSDGETVLWRHQPLAKYYIRPLEFLETSRVPSYPEG